MQASTLRNDEWVEKPKASKPTTLILKNDAGGEGGGGKEILKKENSSGRGVCRPPVARGSVSDQFVGFPGRGRGLRAGAGTGLATQVPFSTQMGWQSQPLAGREFGGGARAGTLTAETAQVRQKLQGVWGQARSSSVRMFVLATISVSFREFMTLRTFVTYIYMLQFAGQFERFRGAACANQAPGAAPSATVTNAAARCGTVPRAAALVDRDPGCRA